MHENAAGALFDHGKSHCSADVDGFRERFRAAASATLPTAVIKMTVTLFPVVSSLILESKLSAVHVIEYSERLSGVSRNRAQSGSGGREYLACEPFASDSIFSHFFFLTNRII